MIKNFFLTAWRNIKRSKGYSALNIFGLAAGMSVALLIGLWIFNEYSFDRWLPGYRNLYQVKLSFTYEGQRHTQSAGSLALETVLRRDIPGIRLVAESDWNDHHDLIVGDKKLYLSGTIIGGDFLKMFQYPLLKGNAATSMKDPYSIVLTEATAKSLFGNKDPMNKIVRFDNAHDLKVTGVLKDLPSNSSFQFSYLIPYSFLDATSNWVQSARSLWTNNSFQMYVSLDPRASFETVAAKVKNIIADHSPEMRSARPEVLFHPLKDWRLYSDFKNGKAVGGFIDYVRLFGIIGILVLMIACINFMNLATARSEKRAREVGVRKAIGSRRKDLILQFLMESFLITLLSFVVMLFLVELALPGFNTLVKSDLHIPFSSPAFWGIMTGFVVFTALLAGSRPAFYLSSFQPVKVLKGAIQGGKAASLSRKVLVVLQFSCSIGLIISTIIIYGQIQHAWNRPSGFDRERLVMTDMSADLNKNYIAVRNELLQTGLVESVAASSSAVTELNSHTDISEWPGKLAGEESVSVGAVNVTRGYFGTAGMPLSSGRDFDGDPGKDSATVILNEAAVKRIGLKQPLGQSIVWNDGTHVKIRGVVRDAVMESPFTPVTPVVFFYNAWTNSMIYRLSRGIDTKDAIARIGGVISKYNPAYPFIYHFVDDEYARKFDLELLIGKLAGIFAGLAVFISCLGLFGLAAYMAEQRRKEIGIRKVLGASVAQLWVLLSRDFLLLVLISCVIATPIAWYYLDHWLRGYEYRIHIGPGVFFIAGSMAILITLFTVSFQAIRAALNNPTKSLRSE